MKFVCLAIVFLFSCSGNVDTYDNKLKKGILYEFGNDIYNYSYVFIIPNTGCTGCIDEAEQFLKDNIENDSMLFILTKINSIKTLRLKLGISLERKNIYVDKENIFSFAQYKESIYPTVIYLKNSEITEIKEFNKENF